MPAFQTSIDVANRACQHVGARRISTFTDDVKQATEIGACYDKLREAELERNVWGFAVRLAALRPVDSGTSLINPAAWSAGTFTRGQVVTYNGLVWECMVSSTTGTPGADGSGWDRYAGPKTIRGFLIKGATGPLWRPTWSYSTSDQVSYLGHNFTALQSSLNQAPIVGGNAYWSDLGAITGTTADTSYFSGELVLGNGSNDSTTVYRSLKTSNSDIPPSANWMSLGTISQALQVLYPIGAGPVSDSDTRNVFVKPGAFLRTAPQDPKAGNISWLGAPHGNVQDDWTWEDDYIVSATSSMIVMRFVASVTDVTRMHAMFCEGLGARIALEVCEAVTQSAEKLTTIEAKYNKFMGEARIVNAIEQGETEPYEDDWISCRM